MKLPYQPSSLLGDEECVVIDDDVEEKKPASVRRAPKSQVKKSTAPAGENELRELMRLCEYEVDQDPYRGVGFLNNESEKVVTPWDICQWGILSMSKTTNHQDSIVLDSNDAESLVRNLTESCCPSILAWTTENLIQEKKKQQSQKTKKQRNANGKKRNRSDGESAIFDSNQFPSLGTRPSGTSYRCVCDSNPFCLGSMGGIVDELLKERCQKGITISIDEDDKDNESDKDKKRAKVLGFGSILAGRNKKKTDSEIEIVDVDETKKPGEESGSEENVFAFMGRNEKSYNVDEKTKSIEKSKTNSEASTAATTASCKPLGPRWSKPETGDPSEVFSSKRIAGSQPFDETGYSPTTKQEVEKLRRSETVNMPKVKRFVQNLFKLCENSNGMSMEQYLRTMTEWHKSLIFVNPMIEERDASENQFKIALPPGIQNLGATCYLNTQLQCLAQIPVFLDGIFSWRPVNSTHKMNGVMTKLQKLLGQMLVGGDGKYTSLDFSNALGIQHNEQQDPNEFARLLFDRMEESFQQCSANSTANSSNNTKKNGLGKLLHRIFHGTTTYETICMKCGKTSVRSEGFMDLNLPIVHRVDDDDDDEEEETNEDLESNKDSGDSAFVKRKRRKKGVLEKAFDRQKKKNPDDTDVQYCFDQYTKAEFLTGDNQYFCDDCNCKQDAKRVMSLTELPPVLNIQLSRYVFDRQKFIKKKLTDRVRLPTILTVDRDDSDSSSGGSSKRKRKSKKKYVLCAVMRHRGTSAYSGHYIAEAMDWTIGQWYEFNDEIVKVLPTPSNSYVPDDYLDLEDGKISTEAKSPGSEDAYNMYYVDEEYLAENSISTMSRYQLLNSKQDESTTTEDTDVLSSLIQEKIQCYSVLTELCYVDYAISERLRRRKDGIRKFMFVDPSSMLLQEGQVKEDKEPYFWVDGKTLRQFVACDRSLDDKLSSGEAIISPMSLLCSHKRLHPRTARNGKLLRKPLYDAYVSLLSAERKYLSATSEIKESDVVGHPFTLSGDITCEDCSKSYRKELGEQLEFLRNIYDVYSDIIDETKDVMSSLKNDYAEKAVEENYAFVVARSTVTKFKKLVVDLMKSVADFGKGGNLDISSVLSDRKGNFLFDGIDNLDLSSFLGSQTCATQSKSKSTGTNDGIDEKWNSKITCSHGNCNDFSLRIVRYVSSETWAKIKKIFPDVIEHKVLLYMVDGKVRKPNVEDDGCLNCRTEKDAMNNLKFDIERWAKETKGNFALKKLLDGKKISLGEIAIHNFDSAQNNCRLVHRDDMTNLCKSVRLLGRLSSKSKFSELTELITFVENLAFPSYHSVVLDFEKQSNARLLQSIRSLTCCEHKRVIKSAIVDTTEVDGDVRERHQLSNNIAVLSEEEYNSYINALAELLVILNRDYHKQEGVDKDLQHNSTFSTLYEDVKNFVVSCHPMITMATEKNKSSDEALLFSLDGNSKEFSIVPEFCTCETCKKDFAPIVQKNAGVAVDSVSVDSTDANQQRNDSRKRSESMIGSIATTPIIVESDLEDYPETTEKMQKIRVFECTAQSDLIEALESLQSVLRSPNSDTDTGLGFGVRRSTRRRKLKFPVGCFLSEDHINIGFQHNIAALRLLLFQDCRIPLSCKLSFAICTSDGSRAEGIPIAFDGNTKTLNELIDILKGTKEGSNDLSLANPPEHCFLLYQVEKGDKSGDIEATLMDSLLEASNIESVEPKQNRTTGQKTKKRSSERGFQGTLLQSSTGSGVADDEQGSKDNAAPSQIQFSESRTRARSNTVISEDENDVASGISTANNATSDSEDDEVAILPSPQVTKKKIAFKFPKIDSDQKMKIVRKLIELTDSKDESRCFEAVSWEIKANPTFNEEQIIDAALSRLFDMEAFVG